MVCMSINQGISGGSRCRNDKSAILDAGDYQTAVGFYASATEVWLLHDRHNVAGLFWLVASPE